MTFRFCSQRGCRNRGCYSDIMTAPAEFDWLLHLDYEPLGAKPAKAVLVEYRNEHRALDMQGPYSSGQLGFAADDWLRRWRFDAFAARNGFSYSPRVDPGRLYERLDFGGYDIMDELTRGQVTVGSPFQYGSGGSDGFAKYWKFIAVDLGHRMPALKLVPCHHVNKDGIDELDRHFTFTGAAFNPAARRPPRPHPVPPRPGKHEGWLARTWAEYKEAKLVDSYMEQDSHELASSLFDDRVKELIVEHAAGFTIELYESRMIVHHTFYSPEDTLKPKLIAQMLTIAAVLGPEVASATRQS